jgi:hypothetical protein
LIANAKILGVVDTDQDGKPFEKNGGCWDYIGYKMIGPIPEEGQPDTRVPAEDVNGNKYVHVNCVTPVDVDAVANALALAYPQIAAGLAELPKFFITDADGKAVWPEYPMRVFL